MVFFSLVQILILHKTLLRIFPDSPAVDIETYKTDHVEYCKPRRTEPDSGKQRKPHDLLRHPCCKCIHKTGCESHGAADDGETGAHHSVISESETDRDREGIERISRLSVPQDSEDHKDRIEDTDDRKLFSLCPLQDRADPRAEGAAHFQQIDHAGADEQRSHNCGAVYKSCIDCLKIVHERDRSLILNIAERIRINHCHSCRTVLDPLIRSARDQIGQDDDQEHDRQQYDKHVGHPEPLLHLSFLTHF